MIFAEFLFRLQIKVALEIKYAFNLWTKMFAPTSNSQNYGNFAEIE